MKKMILIAAAALVLTSCHKTPKPEPTDYFKWGENKTTLIWGGYVDYSISEFVNIWLSSVELKGMAGFYSHEVEVVIAVPFSMLGRTIDLTEDNMAAEERTKGWELTLRPVGGSFAAKESDSPSRITTGTMRIERDQDHYNIAISITPADGSIGKYEVHFSRECLNISQWLNN